MAPTGSPSVIVAPRSPAPVARRDTVRTVRLRREDDTSTVAALSETPTRVVADTDVVVDSSGVQLIDAATIDVVDREPSPPSVDSDLMAARHATNVARRRGP
jgi:hypothetical protein